MNFYLKTIALFPYVCIIGHMEITNATASFSALSQDTRLKAFRLLVNHEPNGLPAGDIARALDVPHNTMSAHLAVLARAGWVTSQRQSRQIIYRASLSHVQTVAQYLLTDCCSAHPELSRSFVACSSTPADNKSDN